ncbi:MAG: hypothetical protein HUJ96_05570 [Marinilabiliaceae bacterium]|nr:hypothetical protein [Marinilabiliaceae bacterium]
MTKDEFYNALFNPEQLTVQTVEGIEGILRDYPYFEVGWMLMLKGMNGLGVTSYESSLQRGVVTISNRRALFELVRATETTTTEEAVVVTEAEKQEKQEKTAEVRAEDYKEGNDILASMALPVPTYVLGERGSSITSVDNCTFIDWLDYLDTHRVSETTEQKELPRQRQETRTRNLGLIESFLNNNPEGESRRVRPTTTSTSQEESERRASIVEHDNEDILTETLAQIYINQQQYSKAINIFTKLSLKNPEKSVYFASRISELKEKIEK